MIGIDNFRTSVGTWHLASGSGSGSGSVQYTLCTSVLLIGRKMCVVKGTRTFEYVGVQGYMKKSMKISMKISNL